MRTLSAMVAALSLGACAAQPPTLADIVAQIRGGFSAAGCAGGFSDGRAQPKCLSTDAATQSKRNVQAGEARGKQELVHVRPPVFDALGQAPPPKLDGDQRADAVSTGAPTFDIEASCRLAKSLGAERNVGVCLSVEGSARNQLAHKWTEFPSADRSHCMRYTTTGGGGTYTDLLTCLEMAVDVRNLRVRNRSAANQ
jgi:hypothetical protein